MFLLFSILKGAKGIVERLDFGSNQGATARRMSERTIST